MIDLYDGKDYFSGLTVDKYEEVVLTLTTHLMSLIELASREEEEALPWDTKVNILPNLEFGG